MDVRALNEHDPAAVPPGWHPDPWGQAPLRWWDGRSWTAQLSAPLHSPPPVDPRKQIEMAESAASWLTKLVLLMPVFICGTIIGFGLIFGRFFDLVDEIDTSPGADVDAQFERFFDDFGTVTSGVVTVQVLNLIVLAVAVARMVWTYRIVNAARTFGLGGNREPGLACAAWIIPIVNFWWPYETMRDLFPAEQRPSNRLTIWWVGHVLSTLALMSFVFTLFLPTTALIVFAVLAAIPAAVSAVFERRLVIDATALVRREAERS